MPVVALHLACGAIRGEVKRETSRGGSRRDWELGLGLARNPIPVGGGERQVVGQLATRNTMH